MHNWTEDHDLVALYLFKFDGSGGRGISHSMDQIGTQLGMGGGSMQMRIRNYVAVDAANGQWLPKARRKGLPGLVNDAKQSAEVYRKFSHLADAEDEIRSRVIKILGRR